MYHRLLPKTPESSGLACPVLGGKLVKHTEIYVKLTTGVVNIQYYKFLDLR